MKFNKSVIDILEKDIELIEDEQVRLWSRNYLFGHIKHYNGILSQLNKAIALNDPRSILEIGGVPGQLTSFIKMNGIDIEMVDIAPERIERILNKQQIKNYKVDIEKEVLPIESEKFDIVLFNEVFEHLHINPLKVLGEIKRVLSKNGLLLMSVPNINPLMRWRFLFGKDFNDNLREEFSKVERIGHMGHFRLYSKEEVINLLKEFDFSIVDISYLGKYYDKKDSLLGIFKLLFKNKMRNQLHIIARKSN